MKINKNLPNILTILRIAAVPVFILLYGRKSYAAALILFCLASLTDMLDGRLARKYDLVSNFGKIMDPLADKLLVYSVFVLWVEEGVSYCPGWFLIIILFREFLIAGLRTVAAAEGIVIAADVFGKIKTVSQMAAVIILLAEPVFHIDILFMIGTVILYFSMIMTVLSGISYVYKNRKVFLNESK